MLFNWQVEDTCVVFQWWHISGPWSLLISCIAIFIIAAFYEWIRAYAAALESNWQQSALFQRNGNSQSNEEEQEQENVVYAYQQYTRLHCIYIAFFFFTKQFKVDYQIRENWLDQLFMLF